MLIHVLKNNTLLNFTNVTQQSNRTIVGYCRSVTFLNSGTRLPNFQTSGKTASRNDRLNNIQTGFTITVTTGLIILLLIRSGPDALFGSKLCIIMTV